MIFPEVPDAVQALARHIRIAVVANADPDYLMRCLNHNGLRFDLVVTSENRPLLQAGPADLSACVRRPADACERGGDGRRHSGNRRPGRSPGRPPSGMAEPRPPRLVRQPRPPRCGHRRTGTVPSLLAAPRSAGIRWRQEPASPAGFRHETQEVSCSAWPRLRLAVRPLGGDDREVGVGLSVNAAMHVEGRRRRPDMSTPSVCRGGQHRQQLRAGEGDGHVDRLVALGRGSGSGRRC